MRLASALRRFVRPMTLAAFWVVLVAAAPLLGATLEFPDPLPLKPLEAEVLADVAGQFDRYTLIDAALVASGVSNAEQLATYRRKYVGWREQARAICRSDDSTRRRAEALLEFMHRQIFRGGYDARATEITSALDQGRFNCVSATVLFNALGADCGLEIRAVELPRHAISVVLAGAEPLDVETTCATWFQLSPEARERARSDAAGSDAKAQAGERREISSAGLVAVIYYNRGVDFLAGHDFPAAVSANLRAIGLDPTSDAARANLLAAINNWALDRLAANDFSGAAELLAQGCRLDPNHEPFHNNQRHVYRLWIESLAATGQRDSAATVLNTARQTEANAALWDQCARRLGL
jgi:tetratricopeptide (TPR) repeat protein